MNEGGTNETTLLVNDGVMLLGPARQSGQPTDAVRYPKDPGSRAQASDRANVVSASNALSHGANRRMEALTKAFQ